MKNEQRYWIIDQPEHKSRKEEEKEYMEQLAHGIFTPSQKQYIDWKFDQLREELLSRTDSRNFQG